MTPPDKKMAQSIDEVEDLTRFADESFDTDEVDLFEFTGVDDSPLTRLKSIILSLDWEISDDILDELVEEVEDLRGMWEGDKVAQVYLQGIDKVGKYLRAEGAYAHPNAIKLLLTLFYNYEKIISSPDISGDEITTLLKSDIRKFKVLQYQIGNKEGAPEKPASVSQGTPVAASAETSEEEKNLLSQMNATILGLEWEVTDEGLKLFDQQATQMREELTGNDPALLLVQGLQALGSYISDEKANAHPDAFTLLHSFNDGLNLLLGDEELTTEKRQEILIDRVGRLNTLKEMIAGTAPSETIDRGARDEVDDILDLDQTEPEPAVAETDPASVTEEKEEKIPEDVFEMPGAGESDDELNIDFDLEESSFNDQPAGEDDEDVMVASLSDDSGPEDESAEEFNVDFDLDETEAHANAAMETADEQYPEDFLDPAAIQPVSDRVADDFIEEELKLSSNFTSALNDSNDDDDFTLDNEALSSEELDEELELIFGDEPGSDEHGTAASSTDDGFEDFELSFDEEETEEEPVVSPDLDLGEALEEADKDDDSGLDFDDDLFLADDDDDDQPGDEEESLVTPALADADEEAGEGFEPGDLGNEPAADLEDKLDTLFGSSDEMEAPIAETEEELLTPALDDADEDSGFREDVVAEGIDDDHTAELEGKLDSFFGLAEEEPDIDVEPEAASEDDTGLIKDDGVIAALADEDAESGFQEDAVVADLKEDPAADLQGKLDSFFGADDGDPETTISPAPPEEDAVTPALAEEELDSFFAEDDTDHAPALSDSDAGAGFNEDDEGSGLADSAMGEIGDKLDSFFDSDDEESDTEDAFPGAVLVSLAAVAAKLATQPTQENLHQVADLVTARKNEEQTTQQTVILTLLESAVSLLSKNTAEDAADATVVRELTTALEQADDPAALIQAVTLYTQWQQKFFEAMPTQTVTARSGSGDEEILLQVKESFGQLRESMEKEFAAIRKDLQKE
jgi:pilus assembly protein FimV